MSFVGFANNNGFSYFHNLLGVADQLQTNYASDLRSILKTLFEVMATKPETEDKEKQKKGKNSSTDVLYCHFLLVAVH